MPMNSEANQPRLLCPSCGQSLRGQAPLAPALLLRCPECGAVTSIPRLAAAHLARRRRLQWLGWAILLGVALVVVWIIAQPSYLH